MIRSTAGTLLVAATMLFSMPAFASLITLDFTADLSFDPGAVVAAGGIDVADIIDEIYGPGFGSLGTVSVTGSLTYNSITPAFQQSVLGSGSASAANYLGPITATRLTIGGSRTDADMALINGASSSGLLITGVSANGFCIGGAEIVPCGSLPTVLTVNAALVADDSDVQIYGPDGSVSFSTRDTVLLALGGTVDSPEFAPAWNTGLVGEVYVEAITLGIVGNPGENLWNSAALPSAPAFFDPNRIDATVFSILFSGPNLTSDILLQGEATRLDVSQPDSSPIPEPGSLILAAGALLVLGARRFRKLCSRDQAPS